MVFFKLKRRNDNKSQDQHFLYGIKGTKVRQQKVQDILVIEECEISAYV